MGKKQKQKTTNYLFVMKSKTVMIRVKRDTLQPITEMYANISISFFETCTEGDVCGANTLSHYLFTLLVAQN